MDRLKALLAGRAGLVALAGCLGLANAVALVGWSTLDPTNLSWIFGDNATYYSGWAQYRHDPHLHFPLAWTDRIGYPIGASIAMLDAIPLIAAILRPLSPILPEPFQYLGLYVVLCFVLQVYFGIRLCRTLFPAQPVVAVLGGLLFLLSAPLTNRAFGHTALLSHWLILAMLDGYFRDPGDRPVRWLSRLWIVLAIAAGITPYVAVMCLLVALAGVARLWLEHRCRWRQIAYLLAATFAVLIASAASLGVLVSREAGTYWGPGYGLFTLNLNSIVNPMTLGSILLPRLPIAHEAQYEGYNYLGLGIIVLLVVGIARRPRSVLWLAERRLLPLVGLALVCTALAASTSVTLGSSTLFTIPLPASILAALQGLRASGRLFWPAYYVIYAAAISLTFWSWKPRYRSVILAVAVGLQLADLTPMRTKIRAVYRNRFPSPLQSPLWSGLGRKYDNLILVPPFQCDPFSGVGGLYSYVWFGKYADAERMRLNSYYAARYTKAELYGHCVDLLRTQLEGVLDPRSVYVATNGVRTVWEVAGMRSHRCEVADGFNLCTPASSSTAVPEVAAAPAPAAYAIGKALDFRDGDGTGAYVTFGWGNPTPGGRWTTGPLAMVRLGLNAPIDPARPLLLEVEALPFAERPHPDLDVEVVVNRQTIDRWVYPSGAALARRAARIPASLAAGRRSLDVELRVRNPEPRSFLGLSVRSLVVRYEGDAPGR